MKRPNFPGIDSDLPKVDDRLPHLIANDGRLELAKTAIENNALDSSELTILFDEIKASLSDILSSEISSNVDSSLFEAIGRYHSVLNSNGDDNTKEIRVGLAISSIRNYATPLLRDQMISPLLEAKLGQLVTVNEMAEARMPNWLRFKVHRDSIDVSSHEAQTSSELYKSVTDILDEAADLVSEDVIVELNQLKPLIENNIEMEKELSFARITTINNIFVSLLQEIRVERAKSDTWISKMLASKIFPLIDVASTLTAGRLVFGWVQTSASAIAKLLRG